VEKERCCHEEEERCCAEKEVKKAEEVA